MLLNAVLIGVIGTLIADLITWIVTKTYRIPSLDFALVGRWFLGILKGQYWHQTILQSPALPGEKYLGWFIHYLIGVIFAYLMLFIYNMGFIALNPLLYAFIFGVLTVIFPFFIMQPAFGFGVMASKTPFPKTARLRSLLAHGYFGIGLSFAVLFIL